MKDKSMSVEKTAIKAQRNFKHLSYLDCLLDRLKSKIINGY